MTPDQHEQIGIRAGYRLSEKLYHKAIMVLDLVDFMLEHSRKKRTYSEADLAWTLTNQYTHFRRSVFSFRVPMASGALVSSHESYTVQAD
jgi:hypothetical protein